MISRIRAWLLKRKILRMTAVEFAEWYLGKELSWYQREFIERTLKEDALKHV